MRVMADDYIKVRNAHIGVESATEYHDKLTALASGERR